MPPKSEDENAHEECNQSKITHKGGKEAVSPGLQDEAETVYVYRR